MLNTTHDQRRGFERLNADELARLQLERLNAMLAAVLPTNDFYREKLNDINLPLRTLEQLSDLPFTYKDELVSTQHAVTSSPRLTYPPEQYVRYHQTSGTHGRPLRVLDTAADWQWWIDTWQFVLDAAEMTPRDSALMAFSFGPFIGFWSAAAAAEARGCLVIPGGGLSTLSRIELARNAPATTIFCTPSYALHMIEVANEHKVPLPASSVGKLVLAGEPGGSVPTVRAVIEDGWGAKVVDHAGASEVGPWGYGDPAGEGLYVVESEFIAEFLAVDSGEPAGEGELSELVLTVLGRWGSPLIRYRTGDLVRPSWQRDGENRFVFLNGGVLGRADDMMIIRGVNVFPSSIEHILRGFPEVVEYRMTVAKEAGLDQLSVEVEDRLDDPGRIAAELKLRLGLRIDVQAAPLGSLPRFEGKGRRFIDQRAQP